MIKVISEIRRCGKSFFLWICGPVLENVLDNYLLSKDYSISVGKIGKFECDFIARKGIEDMYPRFLFVLDMVLQKNVNGIRNVNIVDFIYNNLELISNQQI